MHRQLGIPCEEREDPYCTRPPGDKLYCHLARQRGFDSIQIAQAHFNFRPEMIVCQGKCATAAVRTACPPIPLRSHTNGRRPCKCDKRSALMNCGEAQVNCSFARPERAVLWHHACHTVDLFQYQTGETCSKVQALQGPIHPDLGIAMDMSIGLKVPSGAICTLSLSFNNEGPFGTFFRYICDQGTYIARYDDLVDGYENPIDLSGVTVSNNGIELQDREFIAAVKEGREPNSSVAQVLPAMETLDKLEQLLEAE